MRLVDENKVSASDVCIFEATERVGGRLYSLRGFGPDHKLTVDAGGYRTWPEYTVRCIKHYFLIQIIAHIQPFDINSFLLLAHNSRID